LKLSKVGCLTISPLNSSSCQNAEMNRTASEPR
jgi:hypothetical protein